MARLHQKREPGRLLDVAEQRVGAYGSQQRRGTLTIAGAAVELGDEHLAHAADEIVSHRRERGTKARLNARQVPVALRRTAEADGKGEH